MTRTTPRRLTTRQFSQIGLTLERTFTTNRLRNRVYGQEGKKGGDPKGGRGGGRGRGGARGTAGSAQEEAQRPKRRKAQRPAFGEERRGGQLTEARHSSRLQGSPSAPSLTERGPPRPFLLLNLAAARNASYAWAGSAASVTGRPTTRWVRPGGHGVLRRGHPRLIARGVWRRGEFLARQSGRAPTMLRTVAISTGEHTTPSTPAPHREFGEPRDFFTAGRRPGDR